MFACLKRIISLALILQVVVFFIVENVPSFNFFIGSKEHLDFGSVNLSLMNCCIAEFPNSFAVIISKATLSVAITPLEIETTAPG